MAEKMPEFMLTPADIREQLQQCGWRDGMTILVHTRFSAIGGWIAGGAQTVIQAMLDVIGDQGTLVMPTHSADNSDPAFWQRPPIPESWWQTVREVMPAFDPKISPTRKMGVLADTLRIWHGALRSYHPQGSFAAVGKHAEFITANHDLVEQFGEKSPLARIYDLEGHVFLLGVGYGNNTSLHLAEERSENPTRAEQGSAIIRDGKREWVTFHSVDYDDEDFERIGADWEQEQPDIVQMGKIGNATTRLMPQRHLVDYGVQWMNTHRKKTD